MVGAEVTGDKREESRHERLRLMRALFADLALEIDTIYESNAHEGVEDAATRFDRMLDERAAQLLPASSATWFDDAAAANRFEEGMRDAAAAAVRLGAAVPPVEAFVQAGVDLAKLAKAMQRDPELVAVPTPYGLGDAVWAKAFERFGGNGPRLDIAPEALREFGVLDAATNPAPTGIVRNADSAHSEASRIGGSRHRVLWTLRLVPASSKPPVLGLNHTHGPHVSLLEMLMLQLMLLERGAPPVDAESFTWLAGTLADGRLAARHVYDAAEQTIRINCREVHNQGPHLGARPPIG